MKKTVIIIELDEIKGELKVSAPLDNPSDRKFSIEILEAAINVCKNYKGAGLLIANNALVTLMSEEKINHQTKVKV
jgi:hypothetical protein